MRRRLPLSLAISALLLVVGAQPAFACSRDDTAYFDGFLDTNCLTLPLTNTQLDAAGGLRLTTLGTPLQTDTWTSQSDFQSGITYQGTTYAPGSITTPTLEADGATNALLLGQSQVPLARASQSAVLSPTAATVFDNDNVDDPAVIKNGSTYSMYYSGTAEDGSGPAIFLATSPDGKTWTKVDADTSDPDIDPVLTRSAGATDFDSRGVFAPDVVYDSTADKYVMYYSGKGDTFGGIGVATSPASGPTAGKVWTKQDPDTGTAALDPVLKHGRAGSADSFSAQDPSVLKDGGTWKMWYTGDDSNRKRIAYATSSDGIHWDKGGKVIAPEDGVPQNLAEGAFAPTVWKTGATSYSMVFTGRKFVSGTTYQTKLINASSSDGISWTTGSIALNPQSGTFAQDNLNSPFVLEDPSAANGEQFKLYYSGNSVDAQGNFHMRIGLATSSSGGGWSRVNGSGTGGSVLDLGQLGSAFDSRQASGPSATLPVGIQASQKFVGFYWGNRGSDFKPRLGWATSADGTTWAKQPGGANPAGSSALLPLGNGNAFDAGGQRDPAAWWESSGTGTYQLYFTALNSSGVSSLGYTSSSEDANHLPTTWASTTKLAIPAGTFDANGQSHPSIVHDTTANVWRLYWTGTDSNGNTKIGCATSPEPTFAVPTRCTPSGGALGDPILSPSSNTGYLFDRQGVRDPVVVKDTVSGTFYMLYTGVEKIQDPGGETRTVERIGVATSSNGVDFTKLGIAFDPSQTPYAFDEVGVEPAGAVIDGGVLHFFYDGVDRTGRTLGGHATWTIANGAGRLDNGWNTYQIGDPSKTVRDWRTITGAGSGPVEIWVSFLQPYSGTGKELWSDFFPVDAANSQAALDFVLTVRGVRWQARMKTPSSNPTLTSLSIASAPVTFNSSGSAVTKEVSAPVGQVLKKWVSATVSSSNYAPTGGGTPSGTVKVLAADGTTELASQALTTSGDTTIDLSGIDAAAHPTLKVRFDLASDGQASPLIASLKVLYFTDRSLPTVTLTAAPSTIDPGQTVTLSGSVSRASGPLVSEPVSIQSRTGSAAFAQVATATTDSAGNFQITATPSATTDYQAVSAGETSSIVTVTVNPPPPPPPAPPPAPDITLAAAPTEVVFGQPVTLSGKLTQAGAPLVSQAVQLLAGTSPAAAPTTSATGDYSASVMPQANTTYSAVFAGASSTPTVTVGVHQALTLKIKRARGVGTFTGTISPPHPGKPVVIRQKKGTAFVTFATVKTGTTSSFTLKKSLKMCGKFQFQATTAADADHLDGTSTLVQVEKHRVSLTVKAKGRTVTLTGKVAPAHKVGKLVVRELVGTRLVKLGTTKLTRKSTFRFVKKLKKGTHKLRIDLPSDRCHFGGASAVRSVKLR